MSGTDRLSGPWTRSLLEAMPDAMLVVDEQGEIMLANHHAELLFGYPAGELVGLAIETLVPEAEHGRHEGLRAAYTEEPHHRPLGGMAALTAVRYDRSQFPADVSLSWLESDDGIVVAATVRDLTGTLAAEEERARLEAAVTRDRLEAQVHRSARLESLGQLAGGVAHEFNNLLAVITNYASFVADAVEQEATRSGGPWQAVQHDIEQIQLAAQRATTLTHQLLAFGRQDAGRPRELDVNGLIGDLERLLRRTLGEHIRLTSELSSPLPPIRMDAGQLEQTLVNLAVNARDAMPAGGQLRIGTGTEEIDDEVARVHVGLQPGSYVKIRVTDDGNGMSPEVRRHAFEPFFSTKPSGEGAGLGLATVYGIVAKAGGWAQIYSEPGLGTTVTLLLPTTDGTPIPTEPATAPVALPAGETVLLVEDETALCAVAERILRRSGYSVLVACSGPEALELAETAGRVDLLLTDVMMPSMLGSELAQRLRARHPDVALLYMSGYSQPMLSSQTSVDESALLLEKPFTEAGLLVKVRAALDARNAAV